MCCIIIKQSRESDWNIRNAGVAELADAQASGACGRKIVWVQVPSPALFFCFAYQELVRWTNSDCPDGKCENFPSGYFYFSRKEFSVIRQKWLKCFHGCDRIWKIKVWDHNLMIPVSKGRKSDARLLAGGIVTFENCGVQSTQQFGIGRIKVTGHVCVNSNE